VFKQSKSLQSALFFGLLLKTSVLGGVGLFGADNAQVSNAIHPLAQFVNDRLHPPHTLTLSFSLYFQVLIYCNLFGGIVGKNANAFTKKSKSPYTIMLMSFIGMGGGFTVLTLQQLGVFALPSGAVAGIMFAYCSLCGYVNACSYLAVGKLVAPKDAPMAIGLLNVTLMSAVCIGIAYSMVLQEMVSAPQ
jgi:hypothetical protein